MIKRLRRPLQTEKKKINKMVMIIITSSHKHLPSLERLENVSWCIICALPVCRRLLFPLLHAEKVGPFPRETKEIGDVCTQASLCPLWSYGHKNGIPIYRF